MDQPREFHARLVSVRIDRPSLAARAALLLAVATTFIVAAAIAIPLVLVAGLLGFALLAVARFRRAMARLRAPNGLLDARRNVRVVPAPDHTKDSTIG